MGPMAAGQPNATTSICYKCNKPCDSDTLRCHITRGCTTVQKERETAEEIIATGTAAAIMREAAMKKMSEDFYGRSVADVEEHISKHQEALEKFLKSKGVATAKKSPLVKVLEKYEHTPVEPFPPMDYPYDVPPLPAQSFDPWAAGPMNIPNMQQITAGGGHGGTTGFGPEYYGGAGGAGPVTMLNLPVNAPKPMVTDVIVNDKQFYNISEAGITIMNKSGKRLRFKVEEA